MSGSSTVPAPPTRAKDPSLPPCSRVRDIPERTCKACIAAQREKSCFEVTVSPCCGRDRQDCATCDVYAMCSGDEGVGTERVRVELDDGRILYGSIFVPPSTRLSDLLQDPRLFITIVDIVDAEDEEIPVLFLNKSEISSVRPV